MERYHRVVYTAPAGRRAQGVGGSLTHLALQHLQLLSGEEEVRRRWWRGGGEKEVVERRR
jgi:hypothetical protein